MTTLYAAVPDLRSWLQSTDDGQGTPARLTDAQLTQALTAASARVSIYFGSIMDSSVPQAVPPEVFAPVTLDLAAFYAWRMYLKGKEMPATHPAFAAYKDALALLTDVRDGKIRLDPAPAGGIGSEVGLIINRIPNIFSGANSNTRVDPMTGYLESDTPFYMWTPHSDWWLSSGGAIYQG